MNFIVYDLEATCWLGRPPHGVNEIIEIGAIKLNQYGEVTDEFSRFVKPTINPVLSHFCTKLTSIQQDDVDRARPFNKVVEDYMDWIGIYDESYLLCSWGDADKRLLLSDCNIHNIETEWLDHHINIKNQYFRLKKQVKKTGLRRSVKREGFEFTGTAHRAISDAVNTAKIFSKYIDVWQY